VTRPDDNGKGEIQRINFDSIHVGDIINLNFGMVIPVDGIVLSADMLYTSESAITGNGDDDERMKETVEKCIECKTKTTVTKTDPRALPPPVLLSGTYVGGGDGKMLAVVVGDKSTYGAVKAKEINDYKIALANKPKMMTVVGKIVLAVLIVLAIIGRVVY